MSNNDIKEGDIVTQRRKGFWRVKKIETKTYQNYNGTQGSYVEYHLELVMDQAGYLPKKKAREDTSRWVSKISVEWAKKSREIDCSKWDTLIKILSPDEETETEVKDIELADPQILNIFGMPNGLKEKNDGSSNAS